MDQSGFDKIIKEYQQALLWCKANPDFSPSGNAHEAWNRICEPLLVLEKEPQPPENVIVKEGEIEEVEMLRSEEEKDPDYVDEFHDSFSKKLRGHPRFHELVQQMSELHSKKDHDYAGGEKPLNNLMEVEGMGIPAWVGVGVRISDKYTRMKNFIKNRKFEFKEESFKDTMMDLAVYALLCIVLFEEDQKDVKKIDNLCPHCKVSMRMVSSHANDYYYECKNVGCLKWTPKR